MTSARVVPVLLATMLAASACDQDDMGSDCPELEMPQTGYSADGDVLSAEALEVAEVNAVFPCESAVCVATVGRDGYCSRRCTGSGDCPSAFTCRPIVAFGSLVEETYCAWKECARDSDCGDEDKYKCRTVRELSLGGASVKLCNLR